LEVVLPSSAEKTAVSEIQVHPKAMICPTLPPAVNRLLRRTAGLVPILPAFWVFSLIKCSYFYLVELWVDQKEL
jgi:hypothetical protein